MMNTYIKLLSIILMVIIGTIILFNYLFFTDNNKQTEIDNQLIVESQKEIKPKEIFTLNITNIQMAPLPFKTGEEYTYRLTLMKILGLDVVNPLSYDSAIYVDDIIKINGSDYYVIREKNITTSTYLYFRTRDGKPIIIEDNITLGGCIIKINKENGKILPSFTRGTRCYLLEDIMVNPQYYFYGYLNENSKFEVGAEIGNIGDIMEIEVVGIEEMKNRKCFKVDVKRKKKIGDITRIMERSTYWVDIEKRIPIKIERYEDNILVRSIILNMDKL